MKNKSLFNFTPVFDIQNEKPDLFNTIRWSAKELAVLDPLEFRRSASIYYNREQIQLGDVDLSPLIWADRVAVIDSAVPNRAFLMAIGSNPLSHAMRSISHLNWAARNRAFLSQFTLSPAQVQNQPLFLASEEELDRVMYWASFLKVKTLHQKPTIRNGILKLSRA